MTQGTTFINTPDPLGALFTTGKALTARVGKQISEANQKNYTTIIMEDFNGVTNLKLDRINSNLHKSEIKILKTIINKISINQADSLINAEILNTENSAYSDHNAMVTSLSNRKYTKNRQYNKNRKTNQYKRLWNLKDTTSKQWEEFEEAMEQYTSQRLTTDNNNTKIVAQNLDFQNHRLKF
ncbi:hypothetical protein Glove_19g86 [Diversispora epigaea]|uniref:Uncharacterized protein n=1 Tax=Diversispora epigaea TaxID=1348612 RepID=A0A397JXB6_9GLOM|nr:hypothetical protein Glove_19g86 [Diversispora epigaea]